MVKLRIRFTSIFSHIMLAAIVIMVGYSFYHINDPVAEKSFSSNSVQSLVPDIAQVTPISENPVVVKLIKTDGAMEYGAVGKAMGHNSEVSVLVIASANKKIDNVIILSPEKVTRFERLDVNSFFAQFIGKDIHTPANLKNNIDSISNATDSSQGVIKAVTNASELINNIKQQYSVGASKEKIL